MRPQPAEETTVLSDDGEGSGPSTRLRRTPRPLVDTGASSVSVESVQLASGLRLWGSEELPVMKADFCLYVELVEDQASMENMEHTHALMMATADMLRKIGCEVSLHALQSPESEQLARSLLDTRVYVLIVGSTALCTRIRLNQRSKMEDSDATLPFWLLHHPIYFHHVKPLAGQAQSQQLTKLILKEYRFASTAAVPSSKRNQDENQPELHHGRELLISAAGTTMLSQLTRCEHLQTQLFPLHRDDFREQMITKWREHSTYRPPLLEIYQYFGPTIAMYFSWLDFYTSFLVLPAIIGVALHILGLFNAQSYCLHSFVLAIGTSVFVDFWKRKQREVEYTWKYHHHQEEDLDSQHQTLAANRLDIENLETRPSFRGEWMKDPITQQTIYDYPHHKRFFRQLLAIPLLLFMCSIVGAYVVALNLLSDKLRLQYHTCFLKHGDDVSSPGHEKDPLHLFTSSPLFCMLVAHGPGVLNAVSIHIMDQLYQNLARRLNEYENYRTAEEFDDHLVMKRMPFHFVNSNASLWLLAFYVQDIQRVRDRLWILMVAMQVLDNCKEVALPLVISLAGEWFTPAGRRRRSTSGSGGSVGRARRNSQSLLRRFSLSSPTAKPESDESTPEEQLSDRLERVLLQKRQAQYKDTFADYKEMMIQYGYVALYSPIFPLAPVFAWLNNVIESRSDFFKLVSTHSYQRPMVQHARRGIGVWENVLVGFSVVAVIVNCALVWTYELDDLLPTWSDLHRFMFIVACEHFIFVVKLFLNWAAPDLPTWIQNEKRIAALHRQPPVVPHVTK